ncbi:acetyltransferase (GNAT) family protein [Litoreibacter halocynthiae]|uniref:Acetyltransferase (GNAT) family protein n=1 Tax=Litoreibacter halocynthiae TaxID=1242689 RepID=A0A4R7LCJ2_9RHOB|nr:GNAT family N-acetyltransferase [Litoreibacter halocynthiae]TDT73237.1 acetyltransferase (GNAT) family protein [Litoreibacter halocynthiae]
MNTNDLFDVVEATWPAAKETQVGPWLIRDGQGGGKRVSAARPVGPVTQNDVALAVAEMKKLGQPALFSLRPEDGQLDSILAQMGYEVLDPSILFIGSLFEETVPPVTAFDIWPPLQIMKDVWSEGGIGPGRIAVMERVTGPKTSILGRISDRAAGCAFVAIHGTTAMVHAVEVLPDYRRHGLARNMMYAAARWAKEQGAEHFSLVTTGSNVAAQSLYSSLGLSVVGRYHYRMKP